MRVRDLTKSARESGGRWTEALEPECPCRSCYAPRALWRNIRDYDEQGQARNRLVLDVRCASRDDHGCPRPMPDPQHIRPTRRTRKCKRCGAWATEAVRHA